MKWYWDVSIFLIEYLANGYNMVIACIGYSQEMFNTIRLMLQ